MMRMGGPQRFQGPPQDQGGENGQQYGDHDAFANYDHMGGQFSSPDPPQKRQWGEDQSGGNQG